MTLPRKPPLCTMPTPAATAPLKVDGPGSNPGPRSPWAVAAPMIVLGLLLLVMVVHCARIGGGPTALVGFGEEHPLAPRTDPRVPDGAVVQRGTPGYDGQFYHIAALNPFDAESPIPATHRQRLLCPLVAWLARLLLAPALSLFGESSLLALLMSPATLLALINVIAGFSVTLRLVRWLEGRGFAPQWAVVAVLSAGSLMACQYLTPDLVLAWAIAEVAISSQRRRWAAAIVALAVACLTKEAAVIAWIATVIAVLLGRVQGAGRLLPAAIIPWLIWEAWLRAQVGAWPPLLSAQASVSWPNTAWVGALLRPLMAPDEITHAVGPALCALTVPVVLGLAAQALRGDDALLGWMALVWSLAALGWSEAIWGHFAAVARNVAPLVVLGAMLAADPGRRGRIVFAALALATLALALARALFLGAVPEVFLKGVAA